MSGPVPGAQRIAADHATAHATEPASDLIARARSGDRHAFDALFASVYPELRRIAHARLHRAEPSVLQNTTMVVNECYLKLVSARQLAATDRSHFIGYAAHTMRSIVVDAARAARSARRGGGAVHVELDPSVAEPAHAEQEILAVNEALDGLAKLSARLAQVVEMRYFAGLSDAEVADALGITERTVRRDWTKARLLLADALRD